MLTTFHKGGWIPVTWRSFGADYVVWGMEPRGCRLTKVLPPRRQCRARLRQIDLGMGTALRRLGSYAEAQRHMEEARSTALLPGR